MVECLFYIVVLLLPRRLGRTPIGQWEQERVFWLLYANVNHLWLVCVLYFYVNWHFYALSFYFFTAARSLALRERGL